MASSLFEKAKFKTRKLLQPEPQESSSEMSRLYHPLDENSDEIRLLTLLPKSRKTGIPHCTLETYSLKEFTPQYLHFLSTSGVANLGKRRTTSQWIRSRIAPELAGLAPLNRIHSTQPPSSQYRFRWGDYAALSYVWGDENDTCIIVLNEQPRRVTSNLARALSAFLQDGEFEDGFKLWVDAICINQEDLGERARQLRRMRDIYGSAWAVIAWLGEASFRSSSAIQLIRDLSALSKAGCGSQIEACLRSDPDYLGNGCWLAMHDLMKRPYWYRLWIIQEIIMGASATWIRCGTVSIDWTSFCAGISFLEEHLWLVKDELLIKERLAATSENGPAWSVMGIHLVYQDLSPLSDREENGGQYPSFGRLLDISNTAECSDPRDKVYALVGLMSAAVADSLQPDYTLPVRHAYAATARSFIQIDDNLEPIRDGNPWGRSNAPSGFIVDSISGLSARGRGYFYWDKSTIIQPRQWNSVYGDSNATAVALYRTLVLDRVAGGEKATARHAAILHLPRTFRRGAQEFTKRGWGWLAGQAGYYFRWEEFRSINAGFQLGSHRLDDFFHDEIPQNASELDYSEVYSCFDRASQKRRFMTTTNGYMGWAPDNIFGEDSEQTRPGDMIAVLFGCSTPVVIRRYGPCGYFQVIGEAYVQGLMYGEAMELNLYAKNILYKDDSFRLVSLQPGRDGVPLTLRLLNTKLCEAQPYEAVSYVWGDVKDLISISVEDDEDTVTQALISHNCHAALSSFRHLDSPRLLWIDSICIDQGSAIEKNHQLGLMARIYKNASQVLVHLGQGTPDSDAAMRCIREIDEPSNDDGYGAVEASAIIPQNQMSVTNLFKRSWFFRVWVLQEITFAQQATVVCGDYQLNWESFKTFFHWNVNAGWIQRLPFSVTYAISPTPFVLHVTYAERLLKILEDTRTCGATDPRDKLYAVLPLLNRHHEEMREELEGYKERWDYNEQELGDLAIRQQPLNVQVDYSHPVSRVYTDLAILLMDSVGLDMLSHVVKESAIPGLPTWVPDWSVTSPYWADTQKPAPGRYKPFAGFTSGPTQYVWGWKMLHPHLIDTWTSSEYTSVNTQPSRQIHVQAVSLGKIERIGDICDIAKNHFPVGQWEMTVPDQSYLKHSEMPQDTADDESHKWHNGSLALSKFFRTLTFDDVVYPEVAKAAVSHIKRYNRELLNDDEGEWKCFGELTEEDKKRIPLMDIFQGTGSFEKQAMRILKRCDGKRLCILSSGRIGLANDRAQVGDEVFVVEGACIPFIFRKPTPGGTGDDVPEQVFNLVGGAFVLGVMSGEIWDLVEKGEVQREDITIR
ncbi:heterokaryon incompatibility het-6 [Fusarium pseudocircinatum]|uniref:Heterokaryon incompatibility het-6 n=1 Tax=Fusarium pseudocircinatum TaxID=56676 RepID=A0A8H5KNJ2_9HYPO|nr:heterokaryon incompatibility het-6 [Fusarium pseudocircinatum]